MTTATLSPYACAKIVNAELAKLNIDKVLPPQMFYTYVAKNKIKSTNKKVALEDLQTWFVGYVNKLQGKTVAETTTTEEVVADNDGTVGEWTES
jgi:hypothetical protein